MAKRYLFNVYDNGELIIKEKYACEIEEILGIDKMQISKASVSGYLLRKRYKVEKAETSPFFTRFGIKPDKYDLAIKEFKKMHSK